MKRPGEDVILLCEDVKIHFDMDEGLLKAVDGVDFTIRKGRTLGIVGESGCGKSVPLMLFSRSFPTTASSVATSGCSRRTARSSRSPSTSLS